MDHGTMRNEHLEPSVLDCDTQHASRDTVSLTTSTRKGTVEESNDFRADSPIDNFETCQLSDSNTEIIDRYRHLQRHSSATTSTSLSSLPQSEDEPHYAPSQRPRYVLRPLTSKKHRLRSSSSERSSSHRNSRSRSPRKSAHIKTDPRSHTDERQDTASPLILLHITILPILLHWDQNVIDKILPESIVDDLALLISRVSDHVRLRGILVPHPLEDFELLKARVLEALELDSYAEHNLFGDDLEDQQFPSRLEGSEAGPCQMCGDMDCFSLPTRRRWEVKVYAANGMLLSGGWEAVGTEMERVDVEILPYIPHSLKRSLDAEQAKEDARPMHHHGITQHLQDDHGSGEGDVLLQLPESTRRLPLKDFELQDSNLHSEHEIAETRSSRTSDPSLDRSPLSMSRKRAKEIPLGVLLKNYIYLLAQDYKNVAFLVLAMSLAMVVLSRLYAPTKAHNIGIIEDTGVWVHATAKPMLNSSGAGYVTAAASDMDESTKPDGKIESIIAFGNHGAEAETLMETVVEGKDKHPRTGIKEWSNCCRTESSIFDMVCMVDQSWLI